MFVIFPFSFLNTYSKGCPNRPGVSDDPGAAFILLPATSAGHEEPVVRTAEDGECELAILSQQASLI